MEEIKIIVSGEKSLVAANIKNIMTVVIATLSKEELLKLEKKLRTDSKILKKALRYI